MKHLFIMLWASLYGFAATIQAQDTNLKEDYQLFQNAIVTIDTSAPNSAFTNTFFVSEQDAKNGDDKTNVLYASSYDQVGGNNWWRVTDKAKLADRVFKITAVNTLELRHVPKEMFDALLQLTDTLTKEVVYFTYAFPFSQLPPFLTNTQLLKKDFLCNKLDKEADEFTDERSFSVPFYFYMPVYLKKVIKPGNIETYFLFLKTRGGTPVINEKTAIVLFTDGTKLNLTATIDVTPTADDYKYSAVAVISKAQLDMLIAKTIKKFRVAIFDESIDDTYAKKIQMYADCIKKAH